MRVAICVLSNDFTYMDLTGDLASMREVSSIYGVQTMFINPRFSIVQKGRWDAVKQAKKVGADYLFFIDSDMRFPNNALRALLESRHDIVGCAYSTRRPPWRSTAYRDGKQHIPTADMSLYTRVDSLGTGCMLINMDVFNKVKEPWFDTHWDGKKFIGEDVMFCKRARKAGYTVWCNNHLSQHIGHIGQEVRYLRQIKGGT